MQKHNTGPRGLEALKIDLIAVSNALTTFMTPRGE